MTSDGNSGPDYVWGEQITRTDPFPMDRPDPTHFDDWRGTVQLEKDIVNGPQLHEVVGLDRDRWNIVGINVYPEHGYWIDREDGADTVHVYAVDRETLSADRQGPGGLIDGKDVDVVEFRCHDVSFEDIMRCMKSGHISLKSKNLVDQDFHVVGLADIPVQEHGL